ncbi:MAG: hypothetical protein CND66_00425 [Marine Group II euryarchaeote MED-G37]|nr:MAG: hypothetical protein CND66_00425 [Marine Group II euryarchaeote MED-G37]|tara:strand:- start:362 stop:988 length:627 start_codon:yes stop_codon:yes gene_type:complete
MEMDWKTNMAELGGAFLVSLLVLGEIGDDGNMVMAGLLLAVTMAAMAGAHVLPMFTWISAMTGDLQDTDAWIGNVMRLVFQMLGACVAVVLMAEGGDVAAAEPDMWGFELWGPDAAEGADVNNMDGFLMMLGAGALIGVIAGRCDGWMTAFAVVALAGSLGAGVGGADMMATELVGGGNIAEAASHWIVDGVVIGVGAMLGGMLEEQL